MTNFCAAGASGNNQNSPHWPNFPPAEIHCFSPVFRRVWNNSAGTWIHARSLLAPNHPSRRSYPLTGFSKSQQTRVIAVPCAFTDPPLSSPNVKVSLVDPFLKEHLCLNHLLWSPGCRGSFPGTLMGSGQTQIPPTPRGTGAAPIRSISGGRILKCPLLELWKGAFDRFN